MVVRRGGLWVWVGRVVFAVMLIGLVVYLFKVGLDKADKVGSSVSVVIALVALGAPYLLPQPRRGSSVPDDAQISEDVVVEDSGDAEATHGGEANTGAETVEGDPAAVRVTRSGSAVADGSGSVANTGVRRRPRA